MASIDKDDELRSFDVPEISRHPSGYTIYKIVQQVTPKELTENTYQVCSKFYRRRNSVFFHRSSIGNVIRIFENSTILFIVIIKRFIVQENFQIFLRNQDIWVFFISLTANCNLFLFLERFNPTIIEERRVATKEFLNFILQHLYLRTHDAYKNFFQVI